MPAGGRTNARRLADSLRLAVAATASLMALSGLAMMAIHIVAPVRTGNQVFSQIFEPHLLAALGLLICALLVSVPHRVPALLALVLLLAAAGRYGPLLVSFPGAQPQGAQSIRVMSWNIEAGDVSLQEMVSTIDRLAPDIVGLIELTPARSRGAENDPRIQRLYPYRLLLPREGVPGMGLLSRFPIMSSAATADPLLLRVVVAPSDSAPPVTVFVAHPYLDGIDLIGIVPDIRTEQRDREIGLVRAEIDAELAAGRDLLVLGDFNVTEREPAYAQLSRGLHDAQRSAGVGLGLTWRPERLERLPFGLLRIDYVFASPGFVALQAAPDCVPRGSDHCLVMATFARQRTPPAGATGKPPMAGGTAARERVAPAVRAAVR